MSSLAYLLVCVIAQFGKKLTRIYLLMAWILSAIFSLPQVRKSLNPEYIIQGLPLTYSDTVGLGPVKSVTVTRLSL